jgi:hypothetical protein
VAPEKQGVAAAAAVRPIVIVIVIVLAIISAIEGDVVSGVDL